MREAEQASYRSTGQSPGHHQSWPSTCRRRGDRLLAKSKEIARCPIRKRKARQQVCMQKRSYRQVPQCVQYWLLSIRVKAAKGSIWVNWVKAAKGCPWNSTLGVIVSWLMADIWDSNSSNITEGKISYFACQESDGENNEAATILLVQNQCCIECMLVQQLANLLAV